MFFVGATVLFSEFVDLVSANESHVGSVLAFRCSLSAAIRAVFIKYFSDKLSSVTISTGFSSSLALILLSCCCSILGNKLYSLEF